MKLIQILLLSFLVLSNSLKVAAVYGWYALDVDSFIEQLCENKDKPELQCNGKCYLSKMTSDKGATEEQTLPAIQWDPFVFSLTEVSLDKEIVFIDSQKANFYYLLLYKEAALHSIFHPPQI